MRPEKSHTFRKCVETLLTYVFIFVNNFEGMAFDEPEDSAKKEKKDEDKKEEVLQLLLRRNKCGRSWMF